MPKNNHFSRLDSLLRGQQFDPASATPDTDAMTFAGCMALIDNAIVVVSDLKNGSSRIFAGGFASQLGLDCGVSSSESIWEREIFARIPADELDEKYLSELRFYNFLRHTPRRHRSRYHLMSKISFKSPGGDTVRGIHKMYYIYEGKELAVRYAVCAYYPAAYDFPGKSVAVDSLTGELTPLTAASDNELLSKREKQVLLLVDSGYTSDQIAGRLSISRHTVSRHRQEILAKLQVKNSPEACRVAKSLGII